MGIQYRCTSAIAVAIRFGFWQEDQGTREGLGEQGIEVILLSITSQLGNSAIRCTCTHRMTCFTSSITLYGSTCKYWHAQPGPCCGVKAHFEF